jgi:type I restriction enzyme S subunit
MLSSKGFPCVLYGEIYTNYHYVAKELSSYISEEDTKKASKINFGDILFAGSGETAEEIGKCFAYIGESTAYAGGDLIIFTPYEDNSIFLAYLLNSFAINKQKEKLGQGHSIVHIYTKHLENILIPLPPIDEQHSIAEVLSDVDALIEAQEALIDKKRLIKQGVMQELLTGNRRLPGFSGEWNNEILGNICILESGKRPKGGVTEEGDVPSLGGENIYNANGLKLETIKKVSKKFYSNMNQGILKNNDVLINKDGANTGKVALYTNSPFKEACINEHLFIIRGDPILENPFLYYFLCQDKINKEIKKYITSSAQPGINRSFIENITISLPSIDEQEAISKFLLDMDHEIELQKIYNKKLESLKQGIMQELLTGRIRLV